MRESITCIYSLQKQMGRPKKRQRAGDDDVEEFTGDDVPLDQFLNGTDDVYHRTEQPTGPADVVSHSRDMVPHGDFSTGDSMFAPDGNVQPWTVPGLDWSVPDGIGLAFDDSVPDLTRDNSSENTPPTLNFPTQLQETPQYMHQTHHLPVDNATEICATDQLPTCACLSTLYLTLSNLATMDPTFSFPTVLHPLREAMLTASQVIPCEVCPTRFLTGLQNVQLLNALLMSLAERFSRVLTSISNEANALENHNATASPSAQKSKPFRLADLSTPGHLHTGGLSCAAAFSLSFTPAEWRTMAKKVVRAEVYGPSDGNECCAFFLGLVKAMETRQNRWHNMPPPSDFPKDSNGNRLQRDLTPGGHGVGHVAGSQCVTANGEEEPLCVKMLAGTRRMVDGFDWS
jgi:hypothetical protein